MKKPFRISLDKAYGYIEKDDRSIYLTITPFNEKQQILERIRYFIQQYFMG